MLDASSFVGLFVVHSSILNPGKAVYVPAHTSVGKNEEVKDGSEVWMEADLRSEERKKRTLHWFVDGRQQKIFLSNLPQSIQFGVCILFLIISLLLISTK